MRMQGDIHRAKLKEREKLRDKPTLSQILSGVDDMRINDAFENCNIKYYEEKLVSQHFCCTHNTHIVYLECLKFSSIF